MEKMVNDQLAKFYKGKRVFITGHSGFKGSWLITWLYSLEAIVMGYALKPEDSTPTLYNLAKNYLFLDTDMDCIYNDIRNTKVLEETILEFKPDIIFHLAAQPLVGKSYDIPAETFDVNVTGTANVLQALKKLPGKCTVVVVTTDKVYKEKAFTFYSETDELGGYDPYSASKAAAELLVDSFRNSFFHPAKYFEHLKYIVTARAGNVIGGGDYNAGRIIPDIVESLSTDGFIKLRNPTAVRPWQHVLECIYGYLLLAFHCDSNMVEKNNYAYNFGPLPHDHLTVNEFADIAIMHWGHGKWIADSNTSTYRENKQLCLNVDKVARELGWKPQLSSVEAIKITLDWYKQSPGDIFGYSLQQIKDYCKR